MSHAQIFLLPTLGIALRHRPAISKPIGTPSRWGGDPSFWRFRMKTINAPARSNGMLAYDLDSLRDHGARTSSIKRQIRRQVRHRLAAELATQMGHHFAEAREMTIASKAVSRVWETVAEMNKATIIAFPTREQREARKVLVVRKSARSQFERKVVQVELLAA
jgi:hypothetical protein